MGSRDPGSLHTAAADVVGRIHVLVGAGFGRHPPPKLSPSSLHLPSKVASSRPYDTEIVTVSSPTSHVYGRGVGDTFEKTVEGKVWIRGRSQ